MTEIRVPTLGESVTEATVGKWFKKAGDAVAADEPLVELETDKVTVEVPAPAAGVLAEITVKEGETSASARCSADHRGAARRQPPRPQGRPRQPQAAAPHRGSRRQPPPQPRRAAEVAPADMPPAPSAAKLAAESGIMPATLPAPARAARSSRATCSPPSRSAASQPTPAPAAAAVQVRAPSPADDAAREERVR